jgi:hypothetical protein
MMINYRKLNFFNEFFGPGLLSKADSDGAEDKLFTPPLQGKRKGKKGKKGKKREPGGAFQLAGGNISLAILTLRKSESNTKASLSWRMTSAMLRRHISSRSRKSALEAPPAKSPLRNSLPPAGHH